MKYLQQFDRQRARRVPDPYDPDATVEDWTDPIVLPLAGYFDASSSTEQTDPVRDLVLTTRTLVVPDPDADVRRGDRIVQGEKTWTVEGFPDAPTNPFTGWRPGLFIRLREGVG